MNFDAIVIYLAGREDLLAHLAGGNSILVQQKNEETGEMEEYRVFLSRGVEGEVLSTGKKFEVTYNFD